MKSRLALVVAIGFLVWLSPRPMAVDPRAWRLLAIFIGTLVGIIAKPLPMSAMAVIGIACALATRTLTIVEALSGFGNVTLWLVVSAFFFAAGFNKTGLGTRIAYMLIHKFGRSTLGLGYSLVATDLVLAPAMPSNTARAAGVVFPIVQAIVSLIIVPLIVYKMCPPGAVKTPEAPAMAKEALRELGPMKRSEKLMGSVAVVMLVLWILGTTLNLDPTATAFLAIAALLLTGVL